MASQDDTFDYTAFFNGLITRIANIKERRKTDNPQKAFDFIATDLFQPNENTFSRILAFFLDPKGTHGQGDAFLRIFCERFLDKPKWEDLKSETVTVETEHTTSENGRFDITIEFGQQFIVGVENKIYTNTNEQPKQAEGYYNEMTESHNGNFLLLYLTPYRKYPSEYSISEKLRKQLKSEGKFKSISYRDDIIKLLELFAKACKAPTVEAFINDFRKYIQYQYTGIKDMNMEQSVADYITKNPRYMEAAIHVSQSIDKIRQSIWTNIEKELINALTEASGIGENAKIMVSQAYSGKPDEEGYPMLVEVLHENDVINWNWQLYFDGKRNPCDGLCVAFQFENSEFLNALNGLLGCEYKVNHEVYNMTKGADGYTAPWTGTEQPWLDMIEKSGECSKFTQQIITWYKHAKQAVEEKLKNFQ